MVYIVEGSKYTHKRHENQLQKHRLNDPNDVTQTEEEPIDTIFDMFDLDPPQPTPEIRQSGRKRKFTDPLMIGLFGSINNSLPTNSTSVSSTER